MNIINFLPDVFFYILVIAGIIGFILLKFIPQIAYTQLLKIVCGMLVLVGIYFIGAIHNNESWVARVKELEYKLSQAEVVSTKTNSAIQTKVITKTNTVYERGQDIIQYIDREVVKYDNTCEIPKEFVLIHNRAAEVPK